MLKQKQRYTNDCCLAASASLMGIDYDVAFPKEWQEERGEKGTYGNDEVAKTFEMVGLIKGSYKQIYNYLGPGEENWEVTVRKQVINALLWGRRALIQVPSLNFEGKSHLVAWEYDELWDPSNLKTYTELGQFVPEWIWILDERQKQNEDSNPERHPSGDGSQPAA